MSWGAIYEARDDRVTAGEAYYYKLEDVNYGGERTLHGPLRVRVESPGEGSGRTAD